MTDDFAQITRLPADEPLGRSRGTLAHAVTMEQLVWTAHRGPRDEQVVHRILGDEAMSAALRRLWAADPPTAELRARLAVDPVAGRLLSLAPADQPADGPVVVGGPASWFAQGVTVLVEEPRGVAAASAALPRVLRREVAEAEVVLEGFGREDDFTLRVTSTAGTGDRFVAVRVFASEDATTYVLPLLDEAARTPTPVTATVSCAFPERVDVVPAPGLLGALGDPEVAGAVARSVRWADGSTQDAWRALARRQGPGSALYDIVVSASR